MNSLNSFSVDAGAGIAIAGLERVKEAGIYASGVGRASAGILTMGITLRLTDGGVVVFGFEGVELLMWEDFWKPLADLIGPAAASLLAMLWVVTPRKRALQQDRAIWTEVERQ